MRKLFGSVLLVALLSGCSGEADPTATAPASEPDEASDMAVSGPDLAACPKVRLEEEWPRRDVPLAVPEPFQRLVKSDLNHFAVSTLEGGTVCLETKWMGQISDAKKDGRFLSFAWDGVEAFGHILVDRAGAGTVIDTGNEPAFSPSGKFVAGLQVTEAGWGGLEGFAIWRVTPTGLAKHFTLVADKDGLLPEVFRQEFAEWRIDSWVGEDCLAISAASWDALDAVGENFENAARTPFHARRDDGWAVKPGGPPDACSQA